MKYIFFPFISLVLGVLVGSVFTISVPVYAAKYLSVAVLAALDSLLGGIKGICEDTFDSAVLISGFFTNMLLAAALAFLGDQIGLDLYLAAVIALGIRLFNNLGTIRRHLIARLRIRRGKAPRQLALQLLEEVEKDGGNRKPGN